MLTARGAKVVDFGIAAAVSPSRAKRDENEELLGTPAYLAPERLTGRAVEPASDVYALGVLLHKLITGDLPWRADDAAEILDAHLHIEPRPLPRLPGMPDEVMALHRRCLRKDPTRRPTAGEMSRVLSEAREVRARPAAPTVALFDDATVPLRGVTVRPQWTRSRVRVVAAAVAAALLMVGSWLLGPSSDRAAVPSGPQQANAQPAQTQDPPGTVTVPGTPTPTPATSGSTTKHVVVAPSEGDDKGRHKGGDSGKGRRGETA